MSESRKDSLPVAVVTGAAGMLGNALLALAPPDVEVHGVDLDEGDLGELSGAHRALASREPQLVLHCAAYTDVDGCTHDPARAFHNNATATRNVAEVCRELGARLVLVSTDYVFDGETRRPYREEDPPHPVNIYGESKLEAESVAQTMLEDALVVRTQWMYGPAGKNFVDRILAQARDTGELRVVRDQWGSPTYTRDLAHGLWQAALSKVTGLLHLTNQGRGTWADLAAEALRAARLRHVSLERVPASTWPSPTRRPRFSVLDNARWRALGWRPLRPWREAVRAYVSEFLLPVS
jgi:dTDP-4-dehydrorhamnose reductase